MDEDTLPSSRTPATPEEYTPEQERELWEDEWGMRPDQIEERTACTLEELEELWNEVG